MVSLNCHTADEEVLIHCSPIIVTHTDTLVRSSSNNCHISVRYLLSQVTGVWLEWSCSLVCSLLRAPWSTLSSTYFTWRRSSQRSRSRCSKDSLSIQTPSNSSTVPTLAKKVLWTASMASGLWSHKTKTDKCQVPFHGLGYCGPWLQPVYERTSLLHKLVGESKPFSL